MKKSVKCGIAAAVVMAAGFAAYQTYGAYGAQDNTLLMQNIEALAGNADGEGDSGEYSKPIQFPIVPCGSEATSQNRSCWHQKAVQCKRTCYIFEKPADLIKWKNDLAKDKTKTVTGKRYILSSVFCTGPKTYFHLTEEGEKRGYCINTKNY